jgi:murein DD-endopeptidase MepM/ murein hydrolase activator NlpD
MMKIRIATSVSAILLAAALAAVAQTPPKDDPLFIRLAAHPSPARAALLNGGGRQHSSFEVYLTNAGSTPMTITAVDLTGVDDRGRAFWSEHAPAQKLASMFRPAGGKPTELREVVVKPSESGVLFLFPDFPPSDATPSRFDTAITLVGAGEYGGSGTVHIAPIPISPDAQFVIEPPVRGLNWLAGSGPSNTSDHRRAVSFYGGAPYIGQRYAIDWVELGADGKTYTGAMDDNVSYHAYNLEIHAAADGKIVEIKDGLPENVPNSSKFAIPITDETVAGNHVIEDLGSGHFAAYAHLRPGTIKMKVGDVVHSGEVIGRLGNTGNSTEPHLHFQLCDAPSFLKSEGLPFAIDQFVRQDYRLDKAASGQKLILGATRKISRQEPMENELDSFDGR